MYICSNIDEKAKIIIEKVRNNVKKGLTRKSLTQFLNRRCLLLLPNLLILLLVRCGFETLP